MSVLHESTSHVLTIDVEEYFQVTAFEDVVPRSAWDDHPSRVEENVDRLLLLLDVHDVKATFFILGWVAERHPDLVKRVAGEGHEIASHGWWHRKVNTLNATQLAAELRDSKLLLEELTGRAVLGFRAPRFSITSDAAWAYDVLIDEGYRYDSSVFPVRWFGYGNPDGRWRPHVVKRERGELLELPLATAVWAGTRLPAAGGAYLRHLSPRLVRRALRQLERERLGGVFYLHPWELDPEQPRLPVSTWTRFRHYRGLHRMADRLSRLLEQHRFTSVERAFDLASPPPDATRWSATAAL